MSAPAVELIILTWNSREVLRRALASLRSLTYPRLRLLVVDNASEDGTEQMVRDEFPECDLVQTGANLGYTGGNNRGIARALERGADYVLVLNPDTVLLNPSFIEEMVDYMESHPEVGISGPRVFLREPGVVQNTVLDAPGLWRNTVNWFRWRIDPQACERSGSEVVEAETLNGVCLLLRAACLRGIGLFDENIFMYIEDVDLDYRARREGWSVRYLPIDSVIHVQKREGYGQTSEVSFLLRRNSVYFLRKINRRIDAWGYALGSLALMSARAFLPSRRESFGEYAAFCRRLAVAYWQILRGRSFDASYGPPYIEPGLATGSKSPGSKVTL